MEQKTNQVALFKSRRPMVQFSAGKFGMMATRNHRLLVADENAAKWIKDNIVSDKAMGIYIDPQEPTANMLPPGSDAELRAQQLKDFLAQQGTKIDAGNYESGPVKAAGSGDVAGKTMTAPHFTKADSASVLKAAMEAKAAQSAK